MKRRWILPLTMGLVLTGCADLGAVSTLGARMMTAGKTWKGVSQEASRSCARLGQFNRLADCASTDLAAKGAVAATEVLLAYFGAIQDVANAGNFTVQPGLDAVAASVKTVPGVDAAQADAVSGLASLLAKLALEGMREDALRRLIGEGAPPARLVLQFLHERVGPSLRTTLAAERTALDATYAGFIQGAGSVFPANCDPGPRAYDFNAQTFPLAQDYCQRRLALDAKSKSLGEFDDSLAAARTALDELDSGKARLSSKELAKRLYTTGKELDNKVDAVREAFAKDVSA